MVTKMHRVSPSDAIFPKIRQRIVGSLFSDPENWTYQAELAKTLLVSQSSVQMELKKLIASGILETNVRGNRVYFRPDKSCIIFDELLGIALKTTGLVDVVREFLRPFSKKLATAFIFGSIARGEEHSRSDVDLMLIGDLTLREVSIAIGILEKNLRREVNPHMMTVGEARKMLRSPSHFFSTVISAPKIILVRNNNELARVFEQKPGESSFHLKTRNL
jgi:predicted nucleotidyltransferase